MIGLWFRNFSSGDASSVAVGTPGVVAVNVNGSGSRSADPQRVGVGAVGV